MRKTINRFQRRFEYVEDSLHSQGRQIQNASLTEMEQLWEAAKKKEQLKNSGQVTEI